MIQRLLACLVLFSALVSIEWLYQPSPELPTILWYIVRDHEREYRRRSCTSVNPDEGCLVFLRSGS
jgi:hypothetical protein